MRCAAPPTVYDYRRLKLPTNGDSPRPPLLIEVPHGATTRADFEAVRRCLVEPPDADLQDFFFVNTDVGAPEVAERLAAGLGSNRRSLFSEARILRGLLPRTFVDLNRVVDGKIDGMSPGIPPWIRSPEDRRWLEELHAEYQTRADREYAEVCGAGGLAIALHSYAPRSVAVAVEDGIVEALRAAYAPGRFESWPKRPDVDLITRRSDGESLAPQNLVAALRRRFEADRRWVGENETYHLHPASCGHRHATRWPGQVLCLELDRALLADPFVPFVPVKISPEKVASMTEPILAAMDDVY